MSKVYLEDAEVVESLRAAHRGLGELVPFAEDVAGVKFEPVNDDARQAFDVVMKNVKEINDLLPTGVDAIDAVLRGGNFDLMQEYFGGGQGIYWQVRQIRSALNDLSAEDFGTQDKEFEEFVGKVEDLCDRVVSAENPLYDGLQRINDIEDGYVQPSA